MATLLVNRRSEYINRLRNLELVLDGKPLGKIENGETLAFNIPAGKHTFKSTIDWAGSPEITFEVQEEETKKIEVKAFSESRFILYSAFIGLPFFLVLVFFPHLSEQYAFLHYAFPLIMLPSFAVMLYRITIGRKGYLELKVQ